MPRPPRPLLRALAVATAVAAGLPVGASLASAGAVPEGTAAPTASAARAGELAPVSPLQVWAPEEATIRSYGGFLDGDGGLRLVARGEAFELWSQRPSYRDPIRTVWRSSTGDVALAEGTMNNFARLPGFFRLTVRDGRGEVVARRIGGTCLNNWAAERISPDAPPRSPYPFDCPSNAYTVGSVQGVQSGWATRLVGYRFPVRLDVGDYRVTAAITDRYADVFGIAAADRKRTFTLHVVQGERRRPGARPHSAGGQPNAVEPTGESGGAVVGPVPNLRSLPPWAIQVARNGNYLQFAGTTWNAGNSPLVIDGFRSSTDEHVMDAYQYFFDADGNQTGYQQVGTMHWHDAPSHRHWHFLDFARYSLLNADRTEVVRSKKQSWCLANTDAVDYTVDGADWQPSNTDLGSSCGGPEALSVREVLASGSGDTYAQFRAGQSFSLKGLPNGRYYIAVIANPRDKLVESTRDDNVVMRRVHIGGSPGARTVRVAPVGIIQEQVNWRPLPPQIG